MQAKTFYAMGDGRWDDINNWTLSPDGVDYQPDPLWNVPGKTDDVVIGYGKTVEFQGSVSVVNLTVNGTLKMAANSIGLTVGGTMTGVGTMEMSSLSLVKVDGDNFFYNQGTTHVTGANATIPSGLVFNNLVIDSDAQFEDGVVVNGKLTVNGTARFASNANSITVNDLEITQGGHFYGRPGTSESTLVLEGSLVNAGDMSFMASTNGAVVLNFKGNKYQKVEFTNGTANIYRVLLEKTVGSEAEFYAKNENFLTFSEDCDGKDVDHQPIVLKSGILKLGEGVRINRLGQGDNNWNPIGGNKGFCIPENACFWVAGANVSLGGGWNGNPTYSCVTLWGEFRITAGRFETLVSSQGIRYAGTKAAVTIEGGVVDVNCLYALNQLNGNIALNKDVLNYKQTGGELILTRQTSASQQNPIFAIAATKSKYVVTGGTIRMSAANDCGNGGFGATHFVVDIPEGNYGVSGGTVEVLGMGSQKQWQARTEAPLYNLVVKDGAKAYLGGSWLKLSSFYVSNDVTVDGNSELHVMPVNGTAAALHIGGSLTVGKGSKVNSEMDVVFEGPRQSVITSSESMQFKNVTIDKDDSSVTFLVKNNESEPKVSANLTINGGRVSGKFTMNGNSAQNFKVSPSANTEDMELYCETSNVVLTSNAFLNRLSVKKDGFIKIGSYNLKLKNRVWYRDGGKNYDATSSMKMVITNGRASDGGLTLPVEAGKSTAFPIGNTQTILPVDVKSTTASGFLTMSPNQGQHPAMGSRAGRAVYQYYWAAKWEGAYKEKGMTYTFYPPEVSGERDMVPCQYFEGSWFKIDGRKVTTGRKNFTIESFNTSFSGDFTLGSSSYLDGTGLSQPTTYYSVKGTLDNPAEWGDYHTWVTDTINNINKWGDDGKPTDNDVVVIRKGHCVVLTQTANNILPFIKYDVNVKTIDIREGGTLIVPHDLTGSRVGSFVGDGTLIYRFKGTQSYSNDHYRNFIQSDYSKFLTSKKATVVLELGSNMSDWGLSFNQLGNTFPNLVVRTFGSQSNAKIILPGQDNLLKFHSLTLSAANGSPVTVDLGSQQSLVVEADVFVDNGCVLNTPNNGGATLEFKGNIVNYGTFKDTSTGDTRSFRFGGNIINHNKAQNSFEIKTFAYLEGSNTQELAGEGATKFTYLQINKTGVDDTVRFTGNVQSMEGSTKPLRFAPLSGHIIFDKPGNYWNAKTCFTRNNYGTVDVVDDGLFRIPSNATIDVKNGGTLEMTLVKDGVSLQIEGSLLIQGKSTVKTTGGTIYGSTGKANLFIGAGSTITTAFVNPVDASSSLTYKQNKDTKVLILGNVDRDWAAFHITGGSFTMEKNAQVEIRNACSGNLLNFSPSNQVLNQTSKFVLWNQGNIAASKPVAAMDIHNNVTMTTPFEVNGILTVNALLTAQGNDLTLGNNATFKGGNYYVSGGNTTILKAETQQVTATSGVLQFGNLTRTGSGVANLSEFNVMNALRIENGSLNIQAPSSTAASSVYLIDNSTITGGELVMSGANPVNGEVVLNSRGSIDNLTIESDVTCSVPQDVPIYVANTLKLNGGVLNLEGNNLTIGESGSIVAAKPFGLNNMIRSSLAVQSRGVTKKIPMGSTSISSFVIPLGGDVTIMKLFNSSYGQPTYTTSKQTVYMPVTVSASSVKTASDDASVTVAPIDQIQQVLGDDAMRPYWSVTLTDMTCKLGSLTTTIKKGMVSALDSDFEKYKKGILPAGEIDWFVSDLEGTELGDELAITFDKLVNGDYAIATKFPSIVSYVSVANGNMIGDKIWARYENNAAVGEAVALSKADLTGVMLIINHNVNVTQDNVKVYAVDVRETGVLDLAGTRLHRFCRFSGSGTLRMTGSTFPAYTNGEFLGKNGGTLEIYSDGTNTSRFNILSQLTELKNLILNGVDVKIPKGPIQTTIWGKLSIVNGAKLLLESKLNIKAEISIQQGTQLNGNSGGVLEFCGDMLQDFDAPENFVVGVQTVINNPTGVKFLRQTTIKNSLVLTKGVVNTNGKTLYIDREGGTVTGGSELSYVDGALKMFPENSGGAFVVYHVGKDGRYAPVELFAEQREYYTVEYYSEKPHDYDSRDKGIKYLSQSEWWRIKCDVNNNKTKVILHWNAMSGVDIATVDMASFESGKWVLTDADRNVLTGNNQGGSVRTKDYLPIPSAGRDMTFASEALPTAPHWTGAMDGDWFNEENWSDGKVPNISSEITIKPSKHDPVIEEDKQLSLGKVTINEGATLTVDKGKVTLTDEVKGADGSFIIKSGTEKMAQVKNESNKVITAQIEMDLYGFRSYYMIAKPKYKTQYIDLPSGTQILNHNNIDDSWTSGKTLDTPGSIGAPVFDQSGAPLRNGKWTFKRLAELKKLTDQKGSLFTISEKTYGWALIANDSHMPIDLRSMISVDENLANVVWLRTQTSSGERIWVTYDFAKKIGVNTTIGETTARGYNTPYIAPYQAFYLMVQNGKTDEQANGNYNLRLSKADFVKENISLKSAGQDEEPNNILRLMLQSDKAAEDEIAIVFEDGGSRFPLSTDARKITTSYTDGNNLAIDKEGNYYAIASLPDVSAMFNTTTDLRAMAKQGSTEATIYAPNAEMFDNTVDIYLIDKATEAVCNLREGGYTYMPGADDSYRFSLLMLDADGWEDNNGEDGVITEIGNVNGAQLVSKNVYSIVGRKGQERGAVIVVEKYSDGSQKTYKTLLK